MFPAFHPKLNSSHRMIVSAVAAIACILTPVTCFPNTTYHLSPPSDDQWQYPFNFSPGIENDRSIFGADTPPFDNRDAMGLFRWDTSSQIPTGIGPENYNPTRLTVRVWEKANAVWTVSVTDVVQIFGVGYGPTFTEASWSENSAIVANGAGPPILRDPYPIKLDGSRAENDLTTQPWAVGVPEGATTSPRILRFDLDLFNPAIRDYVVQGLNNGALNFAISSTVIPSASVVLPGTLPRIIFKEGVGAHPGSSAPELEIELSDVPSGTAHHIDSPIADDWQYPFNASVGFRATAPLFAAGPSDPFDYRDGEYIVSFDTSLIAPPGADPEDFEIETCSLRVWNRDSASWDIRGTTYAIEVWGTGFGPTYTADVWDETSPIRAKAPGPPVLRDPYPMTLDGNRAENDLHASPWATGRIFGYNPGAQASPFLIQFDLDISTPEIQDYLKNSLSLGKVLFHVTTTRPSVGSLIAIVTKEGNIGVGAGRTGGNAEAAELRITVKQNQTSSVENWALY